MVQRLFNFAALSRQAWRDRRGNVAIFGAMAASMLLGMIGLSVDLSRTVSAKAQLQNALDSAALAVGSRADLTPAQQLQIVQSYIDTNFRTGGSGAQVRNLHITTGDGTLTVSADLDVPTTLAALFAPNFSTGAESKVIWGQSKLWVSLALDNTGSMMETDAKGVTKLSALKDATKQLLDILQGVAQKPDDVQVALVPFSKTVNVGTDKVNKDWIDWSDWEAAPANGTTTFNGQPLSKFGPKGTYKTCPWKSSGTTSGGGSKVGYACQVNSTNGSATMSSTATLTSALLCPSQDSGAYNAGRSGRYYNGCYVGVQTVANCASNCTYTWTWTPNNHSTWSGCIMDRNQPYDTDMTSPSSSANKFPAENSVSCVPSVMNDTLNHDWAALKAKTDAMVAGGNTNQTVGLNWAMMSQTAGEPFGTPALPAYTNRYLIILSDGLNTQNRWSSTQSVIDDRMKKACDNAKSAGFVIYSVFVNIGGSGSSTVLKNCATDSNKFYELKTSGAIVDAFKAIGIEISQLRVAMPDPPSQPANAQGKND